MGIDNSVGITVNEHKHRLVLLLTNVSWTCNICKIKYTKDIIAVYVIIACVKIAITRKNIL